MRIRTKRIYDDPSRMDGYRVRVDRLWPRGGKKVDADLDAWDKDLAPSDDLRKWVGHDPDKWDEFRRRYREELAERSDKGRRCKTVVAEGGPVKLSPDPVVVRRM